MLASVSTLLHCLLSLRIHGNKGYNYACLAPAAAESRRLWVTSGTDLANAIGVEGNSR